MKYITITEAAERLRVDRSTVWRWVKAKRIPSRRKGLMPRSPLEIPEEALEQYLPDEQRVEQIEQDH
ncbi:MAG: helix-turn-helix domain-containing protein [Chloroflexi bacterium]|nr:helix-turn-helix domain-containing protein [Chloroflexota bacterium]